MRGHRLFALFFPVALSIFAAPHYFLWNRLVRDTSLPPPWQAAATAAIVVLYFLPLTGLFLQRMVPTGVARAILWPAFVWIGVMFLLLVTFLALDAGTLGAGLARSIAHGEWELIRRDPGYARMLAGAGCTFVSLVTMYAVYEARKPTGVKRVDVTLTRLPAALDGFTIVQLSDIHVGPTLGKAFLERVVAAANALSPDLIAITGDLIDDRLERFPEMLAPLAQLRARHGVFFVTGNHEYFGTKDGIEKAEAVIATIARFGVRTLRNERVAIGGGPASFDLAGVYDITGGLWGPAHHADLSTALEGRDPARELVLLAHQPRFVRRAARSGVGLQLSGHTHGGQLWPFSLVVGLVESFLAGLYRVGETQLYVSRGTGYWGPPMRIAAPSEITALCLHASPLSSSGHA